MTIKSKISLYISIFFSVLFAAICAFVISSFSNFRKEEFRERLREKALTSIKLLIEVQEVDNVLLKIIDQNSINQLYNEKTLIFDANYNLIYSSLDDTKINWSVNDLKLLRAQKTFFKKDGDNEIYGVFYDSKNEDYFALISANDNYGKRKLNFLIYLLVGVGIFFIITTWLITFFIIKKQLLPLNRFIKNISGINESNIQTKLEITSESDNEIDLLSREFNFMMTRISKAYQSQKEFTSNASHEFRTPLARISVQLENQIQQSDENEKVFLKNIFEDITRLNELINSLLLLSKIEERQSRSTERVRIDEILYNSIEKVSAEFQDIRINLKIKEFENMEEALTQDGNQSLLEIAFYNLLKNAYLYSDNKTAAVKIFELDGKLTINISNSGETITPSEQTRLFKPFMRGENAKNKRGLGLGLRIVHRIFSSFNCSIKYHGENKLNTFVIQF